MQLITSAVLGLLLSACAHQQPPDDSPSGIVDQFYNWRTNSDMTGAPNAEQLEIMRPLISHEMLQLLERINKKAEKRAAAASKKKPTASARAKPPKPTFLDGDLFSSISAGATTFKTGPPEQHENEHLVPVRFVSARQLPAINWTDRVKVIQEDGHFVVADIEYANHWQLGDGVTLIKALKKAAKS